MLSFFKKRNKITDISWLGVDMHSHILPGIDDGSPDVATSIEFVKALQNLGFEKLICTPHIYKDLYPNTLMSVEDAKRKLQAGIDNAKISIKLDSAAEYMIDQDFDPKSALCELPKKHVLLEMSYLTESPNVLNTIFDLQIKGYIPILAHPERYTYYFKDLKKLSLFKEKGCLMQLNLLSILGYYGKDVKQMAERLLKGNIYNLAGTDLHHNEHLSALTEGVKSGRLHHLLKSCEFKNKELFG